MLGDSMIDSATARNPADFGDADGATFTGERQPGLNEAVPW